MSNSLFVYGTLLPGFTPVEMQSVMAQLAFVGDGFAPGRLYDLGAYPYAEFDEACDSKIIGKVFSFPDDESVKTKLLGQLDEYEGYNPDEESQSLFIRRRKTVTLLNSGPVECWVYLYHGDTRHARLIPHGNYAKRPPLDESAKPALP
jgi:gamma-glutamylcyclotransferase (GGCT)/AIG2-like uncharacterized protein YtfP